jgi:hypothetical protein
MKDLEARQQGIGYDFGLDGKAIPMQAAKATQQVRYSGPSSKRLKKQ